MRRRVRANIKRVQHQTRFRRAPITAGNIRAIGQHHHLQAILAEQGLQCGQTNFCAELDVFASYRLAEFDDQHIAIHTGQDVIRRRAQKRGQAGAHMAADNHQIRLIFSQ